MACEQTSSAASNDERQKDSKRINVMFLCDEWKSSKGGLSTFNREFAVNLAKTASDSIKVHCYVAQSDELSREDARQHGVNLITARNIPGLFDPLDRLKIPPPELRNPDIVVGHGRKFGTPAYFIVRAANCKWMHFVHVFCEENEKKHKSEIELCKAADVVVAVGSRLQQKYSRCLPHVKVEIITPGILEKFSNESTQLVKDKSMVIAKKFNVFMFGGASFEDLTLRGYDIVADAIGSLGKMFELTFVGSSPGEHRKIGQWFLDNTSISRNQIAIRSYCGEQDELKMMFHESDVITLPSRTEGFGLVALEAISAGIAVLVAGKSGIAEALHEVEGGQSVIVESDDAEEWARRIQQLSSQSPEERENNAKLLRDNYNKTYPWSNECARFKRMIQDLVESSNAVKLRIDVDSMKPVEDNTGKRTPVSTEKSGRSQNGGHQGASAVPASTGHTQSSYTGAEGLQAPNLISAEDKVLRVIASNYLLTTPPRCKDDRDEFLAYMEKMRGIIAGVSTELSLAELKLKTTISEEEYKACKAHFGKDPSKECGAVPVEKSTHFLDEKNLAERDDEDDSLKQTDETDDKDDSVSDIEVDERVILSETMKFEAEHEECVRVLPYLNNGDVEIHLYVYSDKCGIPTKLKNDAHAFFGQKGWKLKWADLYNDAFNSLQVTSIEYSSGGPKRLEASQVDEMEEIIDKHLHVFSNHRNVTAVRPSFKVTKSVQTEEACIVVYVLGKGQIPVGESAIPCTIGSYPVDIVNGFCVRTKDPYMPTKAHEQKEFLRLGASIGIRGKQSSGTLGAIVEDVKSGTLYALSCDHVMNDADESEIIHPGLDVYLNSLRFNLNGYKQWIERITKLSLELPQISDDSLEETELQKMFDYLKTERERHIDLERCRRSAKEDITKFETNLEEAFGKRPRVIASYSAGVRCNVGSEMHEGREHFIDAAISKLNEDEVKNVKDEKEVVIIDTRHYPSGECISATTNATMDVEELFKSGSATDFTESNLILTTQRLPTFITDFRPNGDSAWIDVDCINCKKRGTAQSQVQELPGPCEQCRPYRWLKRCLCIQQQGKKPFSDKGDSGAVIFEKHKIKTEKGYEYQLPSRGFGIIFAELPSQNGNFAIASPLEIALEALSKKVSESRPDNEPCQLRLASTFCN